MNERTLIQPDVDFVKYLKKHEETYEQLLIEHFRKHLESFEN